MSCCIWTIGNIFNIYLFKLYVFLHRITGCCSLASNKAPMCTLLAAISLSGHRAGYKHDYLGYAPPIGEWTLADQKQIRSPPLYNPSHTRSISDFFFLQCPEGDGH